MFHTKAILQQAVCLNALGKLTNGTVLPFLLAIPSHLQPSLTKPICHLPFKSNLMLTQARTLSHPIYSQWNYTLKRHFMEGTPHYNSAEDNLPPPPPPVENPKTLSKSRLPAMMLGLSGLIPFVGIPALMISTNSYDITLASVHSAYGACILSFLGGIRWGFSIPEESPDAPSWSNLIFSVTPSLIACLALFSPQPIANATLIGGIAATTYHDLKKTKYPAWFKRLRFVLSVGAILSLIAVGVCPFIIQDNHPSSSTDEAATICETETTDEHNV